MKQNIAIKLSNPICCWFWLHSCIQFKELPPKIVSHPYLIFRNKWNIKHFLFLLTFSYHWEVLYKPHCQLCWGKFIHAGHVILQLILYKLWSKILLQAFQPLSCWFWHHSCLQLEELTPKIVPHHYLIFRNK